MAQRKKKCWRCWRRWLNRSRPLVRAELRFFTYHDCPGDWGPMCFNVRQFGGNFRTIDDIKSFLYNGGMVRGATSSADVVIIGCESAGDDELIEQRLGDRCVAMGEWLSRAHTLSACWCRGKTKEDPIIMKRLVQIPPYDVPHGGTDTLVSMQFVCVCLYASLCVVIRCQRTQRGHAERMTREGWCPTECVRMSSHVCLVCPLVRTAAVSE